jgi:Pyruvate/2-oxoacid:ferredoxin oxidoreductase delta subunit
MSWRKFMNTVIYWFSGSGNSLHVAKALQDGIEDVELVSVAEAIKSELKPSSRIGLVFPVYAWGPPVIVSKFIEKLPSVQPDYLFAVASCGGSPGSVMAITRKMLMRRGLDLSASYTVRMVENYPPMGGAPKKEKQLKVNEIAEGKIAEIVVGISKSSCGDFGKRSIFFSVVGPMIYRFFARALSRQKSSKFYADDKCTSCGICVKICPVDNIEMVDEKPSWGNRCEQCFACFHWCPEESVQYGKKTLEQVRYHHPEILLKDMISQQDVKQ